MSWLKTVYPAVLLIGLMVVTSAIFVVALKHQSRTLFVDLQSLNQQRDALEVEWGQLQLEQETWATHNRIEAIAVEKLELVFPGAETIKLIRP